MDNSGKFDVIQPTSEVIIQESFSQTLRRREQWFSDRRDVGGREATVNLEISALVVSKITLDSF